jgi:hypothetical protein
VKIRSSPFAAAAWWFAASFVALGIVQALDVYDLNHGSAVTGEVVGAGLSAFGALVIAAGFALAARSLRTGWERTSLNDALLVVGVGYSFEFFGSAFHAGATISGALPSAYAVADTLEALTRTALFVAAGLAAAAMARGDWASRQRRLAAAALVFACSYLIALTSAGFRLEPIVSPDLIFGGALRVAKDAVFAAAGVVAALAFLLGGASDIGAAKGRARRDLLLAAAAAVFALAATLLAIENIVFSIHNLGDPIRDQAPIWFAALAALGLIGGAAQAAVGLDPVAEKLSHRLSSWLSEE